MPFSCLRSCWPRRSVRPSDNTQLDYHEYHRDYAKFLVRGAGVSEVNGIYVKCAGHKDGVPYFSNDSGVLLFRYRLRSGSTWWYLSEASANLDTTNGDFYRVKSDSDTPPTGLIWTTGSCPHGKGPVPMLHAVDADQKPAEDPIELSVVLLSGIFIATVSICPSSTGAELRSLITSSLENSHKGKFVDIIIGTRIVKNTDIIHELDLSTGDTLQVILRAADFTVSGSGVAAVNGLYVKMEKVLNEAPCFVNESGIMLFKYRFPSGNHHWYLSDVDGDLSKGDGDYFRVRSESALPPITGWTQAACPKSCLPLPQISNLAVMNASAQQYQ
eukprot:TRINITY_DN84440_c0_g1_i1.p1 TRINITY_DN84440_c0_g1~~TRINITY_DN84440_c0_g1_i1.p1  ORF type:complete len:329 (-),score=31.94 TRINITY_DN84440_c0_g1_i1:454-1440(-)